MTSYSTSRKQRLRPLNEAQIPLDQWMHGDFYFTLDASRAECTLKFVVSFGNIKVKVEDIFSPKVARARHGWEARLAAVTRTRQTREDFEERLHVMQTQRKQKIEEFARGRNFLEANQLSLAMENWPQRQLKIQRKAVFACHRQTVASWRRERLEEEQQERHVQWMSRAENKRREREEQELQHALQLQQESRHQTWLTDLMVGTFVKTVAEIFQEPAFCKKTNSFSGQGETPGDGPNPPGVGFGDGLGQHLPTQSGQKAPLNDLEKCHQNAAGDDDLCPNSSSNGEVLGCTSDQGLHYHERFQQGLGCRAYYCGDL
eukprot:g27717.t1